MNDGFCKSYCLGFCVGGIVALTIIVLVMAGVLNRQAKRIEGQCREIDQLRSMVCDDWNKLNKRISELPKPTPPCACGPIPSACTCSKEALKSCECPETRSVGAPCCSEPKGVDAPPAPAAPVKPKTILPTPGKRSVCPPSCKRR